MADAFVAEIRIFPFSFAPAGWAQCDGQFALIAQNKALFSRIGTAYGGDGKSTFALPAAFEVPDLSGRAAMHPGQGPGLSPHDLGEIGGSETVTLLESEVPSHSHNLRASSDDGDLHSPNSNRVLGRTTGGFMYQSSTAGIQSMAPEALAPAGGDAPHNNMQPYLVLNFCIALQGI